MPEDKCPISDLLVRSLKSVLNMETNVLTRERVLKNASRVPREGTRPRALLQGLKADMGHN